jgi:hypothetical protein
VQIDAANGDEAEHVADNVGGDDVQLATVDAKLAIGDSTSDVGYQATDESEDEVLSRRRCNIEDVIRNLMQRRVRAWLHWFRLSSHLLAKSIYWLAVI